MRLRYTCFSLGIVFVNLLVVSILDSLETRFGVSKQAQVTSESKHSFTFKFHAGLKK